MDKENKNCNMFLLNDNPKLWGRELDGLLFQILMVMMLLKDKIDQSS